MQKLWTYSILFLLFILEGTVFQFLSVDKFYSLITIVPHFVLVMIIFISVFQDKKRGLIIGLIFGLLYDVIFGKMIGVNMIGMGIIGYFSGWVTQYFHRSFPLYVFLETIGILAFEVFLFGTFRLFHLIDITFEWAFIQVTVPTVIVNSIFAILIFKPFQFLIDEEKLDE